MAKVDGRELAQHVGGRVAKHPFGAGIEDSNDAIFVGGDAREPGAVENRMLQGAGLEHDRFAPDFRINLHGDSGSADRCGTGWNFEHGRLRT